MIVSARVRGHDRFAARLERIMAAPANSKVPDEAASIAVNAAHSADGELERHGLETDIRIVSHGPLSREVMVEGRGLWAFEYGSRAQPGTGAFARAIARSAKRIKASIARRSREAMARAARGPATHTPASNTDV